MTNKLMELEKQVSNYAGSTSLTAKSLSLYPEQVRQIHLYKLFGENLFAVPANLIIKGDDEEFEKPFRFLETEEELAIFEEEYREIVPEQFIPFGYLHGSSEIVVLNKLKNTVHIFHVADVVDEEWMKYKLEDKEAHSLETFIAHIQPQTVCCFVNPQKLSEYDLFEIRNTTIHTNDEDITVTDKNDVWGAYMNLVKKSLNKGYELHYAPQQVMAALGK